MAEDHITDCAPKLFPLLVEATVEAQSKLSRVFVDVLDLRRHLRLLRASSSSAAVQPQLFSHGDERLAVLFYALDDLRQNSVCDAFRSFLRQR